MWFHMGIFPMNILVIAHSPPLHQAVVAQLLDVGGVVLLGGDGKLRHWGHVLEGDAVTL